MGIASFPASSSGLSSVVKSVQRGTAVSAGNITISSVDTSKSQVTSFSTGSTGYVQATGSINAANGSTSGTNSNGVSGYLTLSNTAFAYGAGQTAYVGGSYNYFPRYQVRPGPYYGVSSYMSGFSTNAMNVGLNATSLTGGSTALTSAVYGAYLTSSTNLYATGPCQYEIVEYN
jgi:hypothetical protein